jgi:hypothetical protein
MNQKQVAHTFNFLRRVFEPGDIIEIRGLWDGGAKSAFFDDIETAARYSVWLNGEGVNTYFTLNPIVGSSRTAQSHVLNVPRLSSLRSTRDEDVACRNLYLVDIDPVRESGVASTEAELAAAKLVASQVREYLLGLGWPEPVEVASGNGCHLLFKADRCSTDSVDWKVVLRLLADRFDTDEAHIDTSVWNASRISRLPGCRNRKGVETEERPHRLAKVTSWPETIEPLSISKVRALAFTCLDRPRQTGDGPTVAIDHDGVMKIFSEFPEQLSLKKITPSGEETWYALDECPFKGDAHKGMNVGRGKTALVLGPDRFGFSCFSSDCDHTIGDLRRLLFEKTGRYPSMEFWEDTYDMEKDERKWGYIENYSMVDSPWEHVDEVMQGFASIPVDERDPSWAVPTRESVAREYAIALSRRKEPMWVKVKEPPVTTEELVQLLGIEQVAA